MKKDAEVHAAEDTKKKEEIEARNAAESLIYMSEKSLKDAGDKVKPEDKKTIEEKIEALKKVKDGADIDTIKKASAELSSEIQKIGEALYKKETVSETTPDNSGREMPKEESKSEEKKSSSAEATEDK